VVDFKWDGGINDVQTDKRTAHACVKRKRKYTLGKVVMIDSWGSNHSLD
jgi:hypothetical protein